MAQDRAGTLTCFAGSVVFGIVTAMTTRIHSARLLVVAAFVPLGIALVAIEARRAFRDVEAVAATSVQVESVGRTVRREVLASAVWLVVLALGSAVLEQPEFGLAFASVATAAGVASGLMLRRWQAHHEGRLVRPQRPVWLGWRFRRRDLYVVAPSGAPE